MGALERFITCRYTFDAFDRLYNPVNLTDFTWETRRCNLAMQSPLERIPVEVLREILSELEIEDQVAVALCSQYLWVKVVSIIHEHLRSNHHKLSWAGTSIVSFPGLTEELPESILETIPEANRGAGPNCLRDWTLNAIANCEKAPDPGCRVLIRAFWKHIRSSGIPDSLHQRMESCLDIHTRKNGACYLRNLTTKEYIRLELTEKETGTTATAIGHSWLTLDLLVVWLASVIHGPLRAVSDWGSIAETEEWAREFISGGGDPPTDESIDRFFKGVDVLILGNWAGHCLDVVDEASEEMIVDWLDRTSDVERRARGWLIMIYTGSMDVKDVPEMRQYWEYWLEVLREEMGRDDYDGSS
ncbi:hypothetical protein CEP51_000451 [Fusarium floridanum]|uniref:F-box domain-containing protein n=1 Tax=Fusarium floridanum TaxID=1325733 RepID=A0A428SMK5_9HYPO|nr:hypothetical protein CEP51_000451 [Fusarium floridanum]